MVRSFRPALLCAATFLAPLAASAGEITLFEDAGFRGRPVTLRSDTGDLSRMGFNDKTSSIIVRVSRIVIADNAAPSTMPGSSICCRFSDGDCMNGVNSIGGDQPHQIDGNTTTIVPSQKLGTASSRIENERAR